MRKVRFEYKGQMINYYNKLRKENEKGTIKFSHICGGCDKDGYYVEYTYNK